MPALLHVLPGDHLLHMKPQQCMLCTQAPIGTRTKDYECVDVVPVLPSIFLQCALNCFLNWSEGSNMHVARDSRSARMAPKNGGASGGLGKRPARPTGCVSKLSITTTCMQRLRSAVSSRRHAFKMCPLAERFRFSRSFGPHRLFKALNVGLFDSIVRLACRTTCCA